jgi:hypothetical protein
MEDKMPQVFKHRDGSKWIVFHSEKYVRCDPCGKFGLSVHYEAPRYNWAYPGRFWTIIIKPNPDAAVMPDASELPPPMSQIQKAFANLPEPESAPDPEPVEDIPLMSLAREYAVTHNVTDSSKHCYHKLLRMYRDWTRSNSLPLSRGNLVRFWLSQKAELDARYWGQYRLRLADMLSLGERMGGFDIEKTDIDNEELLSLYRGNRQIKKYARRERPVNPATTEPPVILQTQRPDVPPAHDAALFWTETLDRFAGLIADRVIAKLDERTCRKS